MKRMKVFFQGISFQKVEMEKHNPEGLRNSSGVPHDCSVRLTIKNRLQPITMDGFEGQLAGETCSAFAIHGAMI